MAPHPVIAEEIRTIKLKTSCQSIQKGGGGDSGHFTPLIQISVLPQIETLGNVFEGALWLTQKEMKLSTFKHPLPPSQPQSGLLALLPHSLLSSYTTPWKNEVHLSLHLWSAQTHSSVQCSLCVATACGKSIILAHWAILTQHRRNRDTNTL